MNTNPDCLFCKINAGEIPSHRVFENDDVTVFLNIFPFEPGQLLIVPKHHAPDMNSGRVEDAEAMMRTVFEESPKWLKALGAVAYNLGMNHGEESGQEVFHTHLHWIPRYEGGSREFKKTFPSQEELAVEAEKFKTVYGH